MTNEVIVTNEVTGEQLDLARRVGTKAAVYFLDEIDWGTVESEHRSYKYINQIGVYVTGSTLETREVLMIGWIYGSNHEELSLKREKLNKMINPLQLHSAKVKEYKLEFLPKNSISYSASLQENNEVMCRFSISGFCPDPLFYSEIENKVEAASTHPFFMWPLIIPDVGHGKPDKPPGVNGGIIMGLREPSLLVPMYNDGAVATGMRIEFIATATVLNPYIVDATTMEYIKINKTMIAGEKIVIVTQEGKKSVTGSVNNISTNYYEYRDLNSSWLQLQVGDNLFRYDADGNVENLEVNIFFYSRYLEVE